MYGRKIRLGLIFVGFIATLLVAQPVSAALTSVVNDPVGDAVLSPKITAPAYQDIVEAAITLKDGRFILVKDLAAPIPATPALPPGIVLVGWSWNLNTNPATFPAGFPFSPGSPAPPEFIVFMLWDGTGFTGIVIDRRPLLTGGEAIITSVPFDIKRAEITVRVDAGLLGDPSSFTWVSRTNDWATPFGTNSNFELDRAPNFGPATWPS